MEKGENKPTVCVDIVKDCGPYYQLTSPMLGEILQVNSLRWKTSLSSIYKVLLRRF